MNAKNFVTLKTDIESGYIEVKFPKELEYNINHMSRQYLYDFVEEIDKIKSYYLFRFMSKPNLSELENSINNVIRKYIYQGYLKEVI